MNRWIKNWFSNYEPFDEPLVYGGLVFRYPEVFYQAMKAEKVHVGIRTQISNMAPGQAKKFWRKKENQQYLRPDWFDVNREVMKFILNYKFSPGTSWYNKLMKQEGLIIEVNNWHDNYWGYCVCEKCMYKPKFDHLGRMITDLRDRHIARMKTKEKGNGSE